MQRDGADRVGHGEASLGEAQSHNPPHDPEMIEPDAVPFDADSDGDDEPPPVERDNEDPSPNAP